MLNATSGWKDGIFLVALLAAGSPAAVAQQGSAPEPLGIETCDAFLSAYEACASGPGVPDTLRTALRQSITSMRDGFRQAARDERARKTIAYQCAQSHPVVRQRVMEAFKCDFPAPSAASAALAAQMPTPGRPSTDKPAASAQPASADVQAAAKANAYVEVQNTIVTFHPFARQLADYLKGNDRVLRAGAKLDGNSWYSFGVPDCDALITRLKAAIERPGEVPEVDGRAKALLAALEALNPTIKALNRYQNTREFRDDAFKFAREQHPIFAGRMEAAVRAANAYGDGLFDRELARDERKLAALAPDAPPARLLATSLAVKRAVRRYEALGPKSDPGPFQAALADVSAANGRLLTTLDALNPKASTSCTGYVKTIDSVVGHGRDVVRDLRSGGDLAQPSQLFGMYYNRSVEDLSSCNRDEERLRP